MPESSYPRWQAFAIQQKQTTSALLLAFSGAVLAFLVAQIPTAAKYIGATQSALIHFSGIAHLLSMAFGIGFSFNRVRDFDVVAKIARTRQREPKAPRLGEMRRKSRALGRITRRLFAAQAISFVLGSISALIFVFVHNAPALYGNTVQSKVVAPITGERNSEGGSGSSEVTR